MQNLTNSNSRLGATFTVSVQDLDSYGYYFSHSFKFVSRAKSHKGLVKACNRKAAILAKGFMSQYSSLNVRVSVNYSI